MEFIVKEAVGDDSRKDLIRIPTVDRYSVHDLDGMRVTFGPCYPGDKNTNNVRMHRKLRNVLGVKLGEIVSISKEVGGIRLDKRDSLGSS